MLTVKEATCRAENLTQAYNKYRRYRGLWLPGIPMSEVRSEPVGHMLKLAEIINNGSYTPSPPQHIAINKADGTKRHLRVYAISDRVAQRALLKVLQDRTEKAMSVLSFGYRPGRKVQDAIDVLQHNFTHGKFWAFDADIKGCFDNINRSLLLKEVARRIKDDTASDLIATFMKWDVENTSEKGIPQGSVLAPWLCNLFLWQLDDFMINNRMCCIRFADDFVIPTRTKADAEHAHKLCNDFLRQICLQLHPGKTSIIPPGKAFRFLGKTIRSCNQMYPTQKAA